MEEKENICAHCGSKNTSSNYTDTFPSSGNDQDDYSDLVEIDLFDCLKCGELAQQQ